MTCESRYYLFGGFCKFFYTCKTRNIICYRVCAYNEYIITSAFALDRHNSSHTCKYFICISLPLIEEIVNMPFIRYLSPIIPRFPCNNGNHGNRRIQGDYKYRISLGQTSETCKASKIM